MRTVRLTEQSRQQFVDRLSALQPDTPRAWGTLTPIDLLAHLRRSLEVSLGEVPVKDEGNLFTRTLMRWLAFHVMPTWPKGKIRVAPSMTPPAKEDFETERRVLFDTIDRFLAASREEPDRKTLHPAFGRLRLEYWRHIHGRHFRHHFEQFGL